MQQCIRVASLTTWAITLTGIAAGHAVDAGGSGELELSCGIVPATETNPDFFTPDDDLPPLNHVVLDQPLGKEPFERIIPATRALRVLAPVDLSVPAAVATDKRELVAVAAQLVSELVAEFGYLPSDPMLTPDGLVVADNCRAERLQAFFGWAQTYRLLDEQQSP